MRLEPHITKDESTKYSPSKLDVYKNCPKRYLFRYVDRVARDRKTPETVLGVAVHAAFEELYERVAGGQTPALAEVQGWFEAAFAEGWTDDVLALDRRFTKDDWRGVGRDCVRLYYEKHRPFDADRTIAVEKRVGFPLEVEGHEYRIEGFVDRLSLAPDGAVEIHDYKTSKSLPPQDKLDQDWQLALYELAVRREWPDTKTVRLKWHYVRHGVTLESRRDDASRERLRTDVASLISEIKRDVDFKPRKSALCDWCEYKDLCPEFKHEVRVAAMTPVERGADEGVRLADAFADVEARRRRVRDELKALDKEKDELVAKLAAWAQAEDVTTVAGGQGEVALSFKDEMRLPTKTGEPERYAELEAEARRSPLWGDVSRLDGAAVVEGVKSGRWDGALLEQAESWLERFGERAQSVVARLRKRASSDD